MKPGSNGHGSFRVSISTVIISRIKQVLRTAGKMGDKSRFLQALKQINERLENDPGSFGEPLFFLKGLGLEMRLAAVPPLAVTFGVNYAARTVFVSKIKATSQAGTEEQNSPPVAARNKMVTIVRAAQRPHHQDI